MRTSFIVGIAVFIGLANISQAQQSVSDSVIGVVLIDVTYTLQSPGGDLSDRFGLNSAVGGSFYYKTKSNWLIGASGNFMFGSDVKERTMLDGFRDENGGILGTTGLYANVLLYQRGFNLEARVGKIFPWFGPNPNSGIMVTAGVGFLQHKIRFEDSVEEVPLLLDDNAKGYDRLTNGLMISQFIGYRYLGNRRLMNFIAGIEVMEAFTRNRRQFNYDTRSEDNESRLDLLYGFRIGFTLPLYKRVPKEFYYE